jgi:hypothetical protein
VPFLLQITECWEGSVFLKTGSPRCHSRRFEALVLCLQTASKAQEQKTIDFTVPCFAVEGDNLLRLNTVVA